MMDGAYFRAFDAVFGTVRQVLRYFDDGRSACGFLSLMLEWHRRYQDYCDVPSDVQDWGGYKLGFL